MTDVFCIGYSQYEPQAARELGEAVDLRKFGVNQLAFFYPQVFYRIKEALARKLSFQWNYEGGIDILIFATQEPNPIRIDWTNAGVASSRRHIPEVFQDEDQMIRAIINRSEREAGDLTIGNLKAEINRRRARGIASGLVSRAIEIATSAGVGYIFGS